MSQVTATGPVANAVYAVWATDEDTGPGLCCWPGHSGIFTDFTEACSLAGRAGMDPSITDVEIVAYVGKEGLDTITARWEQERAKWAQAA